MLIPSTDIKVLLVLYKGKKNESIAIGDALYGTDILVYIVGMGIQENKSVPMLRDISANHGGYMLVTDSFSHNNKLILERYFLEILADINRTEILKVAEGSLIHNKEQAIPFYVTEADLGLEVIFLTQYTEFVNYRLQTPNGLILERERSYSQNSLCIFQSSHFISNFASNRNRTWPVGTNRHVACTLGVLPLLGKSRRSCYL